MLDTFSITTSSTLSSSSTSSSLSSNSTSNDQPLVDVPKYLGDSCNGKGDGNDDDSHINDIFDKRQTNFPNLYYNQDIKTLET
ncbi:MAG TPA: hypothetical protein VD815_10730 [Candidatus Saccharimonadales bacterium]|nr:hypothetical protein [Candidatus Saccharimonadales bacterium]